MNFGRKTRLLYVYIYISCVYEAPWNKLGIVDSLREVIVYLHGERISSIA